MSELIGKIQSEYNKDMIKSLELELRNNYRRR